MDAQVASFVQQSIHSQFNCPMIRGFGGVEVTGQYNTTLTPRKASGLNVTVLPDGRWLLYDEADHSAVTLSAPAGILWELCDGKTSIASLIEQMKIYYPHTSANRLESEILQMLDEFVTRGLISRDASCAV